MTKNEKQIIIDNYAEYKIAYGFYREQKEHEDDIKEIVEIDNIIRDMAIKSQIVKDIINSLEIEIVDNYIEIGRNKYKEIYNIK